MAEENRDWGYRRIQGALSNLGHEKPSSRANLIKAYLWVLDTNQTAIRAYLRWGGRLEPGCVKDHVIGGQPVKEALVSFDL